MTEYIRKQLIVDAMEMKASGVIDGVEFEAGDFLVSYADGSMGAMPNDTFLANYELNVSGVIEPQHIPEKKQPARPVITVPTVPVASEEMFTCIGCSRDVPLSNFDRNQGLCKDCLQVKCPTCGNINKLSDMKGRYCPHCLGSPLT